MKPTTQAVRAIAAEFARRKLRPVAIVTGCVVVVLIGLGFWLVVQNAWWWLLLAPILLFAVALVLLTVILQVSLQLVDSVQTGDQKQSIRAYVDQLERVAETIQTPYPVILIRVVYEIIRPRPNGFVATISRDSRGLAPEFSKLIRSFESVT